MMTTTDTEIQEICDVLSSPNYGSTFDGGSETSRREIAEDWHDHDFSAGEVGEWCDAGCWDAAAAAELRDAGFSPASDTLSYRAGHERDDMTPMYALCNGDTSLAKLEW